MHTDVASAVPMFDSTCRRCNHGMAPSILQDDRVREDALLRAALRGEQESAHEAIAISAERLHDALQRANHGVHAEHRSATNVWRSPLSLFDSRAEATARQKGIPSWAIDAVLKAQRLGFEAAQLGDRTDAYKMQIDMAKRERRGIARAPLLRQLEQLDLLAQRLREHAPILQAARALFDAPRSADCSAVLPPEAALAAQRAAAEAARRGGAPSLRETGVRAEAEAEVEQEAPCCILEQRPSGARRLWREVVSRSREQVPRLLESALDLGVGRLLLAMESAGVAAAAPAAQPIRDGETARVLALPWSSVCGRPSAWLGLEEAAEERLQQARALALQGLPGEARGDSAKGRWERCRRRSDRRWTLA